jgi:predicted transcriptional regulator
MTATISLEKKRQLYELRKEHKKRHNKEMIVEILEERGGKEKTTVVFYHSTLKGLKSRSEFRDLIVELEEEGRLQITGEYGEYLILK